MFFLFLIALLIIVGYRLIPKSTGKFQSAKNSSSGTKTAEAKVFSEVKRSFEFPAEITNGGVETIIFTIDEAEIKDEIKVQGKPRPAPEEKAYLLLRLELVNDSVEELVFQSPNFVRLIGEGDKKFAPDFHNGKVTIDPLSVRRDLISFIVDESARTFSLLVGELGGEKERVEVTL